MKLRKKNKDEEKIKKMELFESIIKKIFPDIKPDELTMCKNIVENLLKNKLVRKTKLSKIMIFYFKKKFSLCSDYSIKKNTVFNLLQIGIGRLRVPRILKLPLTYAQIALNNKFSKLMFGNVATDYILYPLLMTVVKNKLIVLVILAFV